MLYKGLILQSYKELILQSVDYQTCACFKMVLTAESEKRNFQKLCQYFSVSKCTSSICV